MASADYRTNFTNPVRIGPTIVTSTGDTSLRNDSAKRDIFGTYQGAAQFTSPQVHLPFAGTTDAARLKNFGSFIDFDDDTTGTIQGTGTF